MSVPYFIYRQARRLSVGDEIEKPHFLMGETVSKVTVVKIPDDCFTMADAYTGIVRLVVSVHFPGEYGGRIQQYELELYADDLVKVFNAPKRVS